MLSLILAVAALLIALLAVGPASRLAEATLACIQRCSRRRKNIGLVILGLSLGSCLLTVLVLFWPMPSVHDEFAYILAAETFAAGQWTNGSHPLHEHFESWHIIQQPSYQGKYPPAQGVVLAVGYWLVGEYLVGVWLCYALAMLASYWAAASWLPRRWALLATLLLMTNVPLAFAWGNSYWGGAAAMLGGSLLVGGWGSIRRGYASWFSGLAFGLGMGILAASRPFEGALMALPIGIDSLLHSRRLTWSLWRRFWVPSLMTVAGCLVALCIFHQAVTGHPLKMPYQVWTAQQGQALARLLTPAMVLVKAEAENENPPAVERDKEHSHPASERSQETHLTSTLGKGRPTSFTRDWRSVELAYWMKVRGKARWAFTWDKLLKTYAFYFQAVLCLPLVALPWLASRQRGLVVMLVAIGLETIGCCLHLSAGHAHYVAGLTCLLMIVSTACLRSLYLTLPSLGKPLLGATLIVWSLTAVICVAGEVVMQPHRTAHAWAHRRHNIEEELTAREHDSQLKQLVFVRYASDHNVHREWVYNAADIDAAPVTWANDLGQADNERLIEYYRQQCVGCEVWLLIVGREGERLIPYDEQARIPISTVVVNPTTGSI